VPRVAPSGVFKTPLFLRAIPYFFRGPQLFLEDPKTETQNERQMRVSEIVLHFRSRSGRGLLSGPKIVLGEISARGFLWRRVSRGRAHISLNRNRGRSDLLWPSGHL